MKLVSKLYHLEAAGLVNTEEFRDTFGEMVSLFGDLTDFSVSTPDFSGLVSAAGRQSSISILNSELASAYGAGAAYLGTAGTSLANVALLLALQCAREGQGSFIIDSAAHASIHGGLLSSGGRAIVLQRKRCPRTNIPLSNIEEPLARLLSEHANDCTAVVLTMPGYVGDLADLAAIFKLCQRHSVDLVLDGAWGALFGLHPSFPEALIQYADFVTLSLHKSALGPQQVSLTLIRDAARASDLEAVLLQGFATTSPNPALLLATEHRVLKVLDNPECWSWDGAIAAADYVKSRIADIHPKLRVLEAADLDAVYINPIQIILDTADVDVSAIAWKTILSERFMRDAEHAEEHFLLLSFAPGNHEDLDQLVSDLKQALNMAMSQKRLSAAKSSSAGLETGDALSQLDIRAAMMSPSERIPVRDAVGRVLAGLVMTYPTGRGLPPGTVLSEDNCQAILEAVEAGDAVYGVEGEETASLKVVSTSARQAMPPYLQIETHRTPGLPDALLNEVSDFYASGWVEEPFNQFVIHEDAPRANLSPAEYFGATDLDGGAAANENHWHTLDELNEICAELPPGYHRIVDPAECRKVHEARFSDSGYLTLVRDLRTGKIVGMLNARVATFRRLAETTEWFRPHLFCSTYGQDKLSDGFDRTSPEYLGSLEKLAWHFDLSENHQVCTIDAQLLHPDVRQTGAFRKMMQAMARAFEPAHAYLPLLSTVSSAGSLARTLNESAAGRLVYDVLPSGDCLAYSDRTFHTMAYALASGSHWAHAIGEQVKKETQTYQSSAWDHPNVIVKQTEDGRGFGVFASGGGIKKGETVARFVGEVYRSEAASSLHPEMVNHAIQESERGYVFGRFGLAQLINHSCAPNLGLHGRVELRALTDIPPGSELTWHYSSSEDSDWSMQCHCGSPACLGQVFPFSKLPEKERIRLLETGLVSEWITDKLAVTLMHEEEGAEALEK